MRTWSLCAMHQKEFIDFKSIVLLRDRRPAHHSVPSLTVCERGRLPLIYWRISLGTLKHRSPGMNSGAETRHIVVPLLCAVVSSLYKSCSIGSRRNEASRHASLLHLHGVPKLLFDSRRGIAALLLILPSHRHLARIIRQSGLTVFHSSFTWSRPRRTPAAYRGLTTQETRR